MGLLAVTILVYFGAWLIDVFLDENIYKSVLNMSDPTSAVSIGWTTVRDACNTFFILFLLLIAFSTILRIQTYNAKSLLPKFIISLFLINFSATIAMMVIDFGQVFMFEIKSWMGTGGFSAEGGAGSPLTTIVDYFNNEYNLGSPSGKFLLEDVVGVAFAVAYSTILGLLYIMLALFLMVRIIVFVILVIISPFAFFSIILPGMRTYTSQWWSSLVSHAIFGPVFLFFIFLSGKMAQSMQAYTPPPTTTTEIDSLSYIIAILIPHVVALGMLFAAIPVTQKLGAAGSSKIIGGAAGIGKIAAGTYAGVKLAGGLGKKTGGGIASRNDRVGGWIDRRKAGYYKNLEKAGLKGSAIKGRASMEKSKEDKMKKIEVEFGDLRSIDLKVLETKANGTFGTSDDKALWLKAATAQSKLGEHEDTAKKFMTGAERSLSGKEMSGVTDKSLVLATKTSEAQRDIKSKTKTEEQVMTEKMNDVIKDGKAHEVQGLSDATAAKVWHEAQETDQRKSSLSRMNKEDKKSLSEGYFKNTIQNETAYATLKSNAVSRDPVMGPAARKKIEKDDEFRAKAVETGKDLEKSFTVGSTIVADKIENAFGKFDAKTVGKFSEEQLEKYGHNTTAAQWRDLDRSNKTTQYNIVLKAKQKKAGAAGISVEEKKKLDMQIKRMEGLLTGNNR
jgi:hypothetical protein